MAHKFARKLLEMKYIDRMASTLTDRSTGFIVRSPYLGMGWPQWYALFVFAAVTDTSKNDVAWLKRIYELESDRNYLPRKLFATNLSGPCKFIQFEDVIALCISAFAE